MFSFRKADISELGAIKAIAEATWPQTYEPLLGKEQVSYMLDLIYSINSLTKQYHDGQSFYFIYNKNDIAGFAAFRKVDFNSYKLEKIYILPEHQGTGAGTALLQFIIMKVRSLGATELLLHVNRENKARLFYEKMGFAVIEEKDTDIGNGFFMNDYIMKLSIDL